MTNEKLREEKIPYILNERADRAYKWVVGFVADIGSLRDSCQRNPRPMFQRELAEYYTGDIQIYLD